MTTQQKALELARESVAIAQVSYENGVITSAELSDAQVALLLTEYQLQQAKYARIVAAARARFAAGVSEPGGGLVQRAEMARVASCELRPGVSVAHAAQVLERPRGRDAAHLGTDR